MKRRFTLFALCCTATIACAVVPSSAGMAADALQAAPEPAAQQAAVSGDTRIPFPKPDSHRGNWLQYHGRTVALTGSSSAESGKACLACHERNDCVKCHMTNPPKDHTNFWRTRGHGLTAAVNNERCVTCHRQDYCVACHNETTPRSHTAGWQARHCTWCHFGSRIAPADNCSVCHKTAPHTSAPHPVSGSLDCALCH